jgi:hypothetical protein
MITLLTTSISRSGKPLRASMPQFHMTRSDAEAVVAYPKSLNASHRRPLDAEQLQHAAGRAIFVEDDRLTL